MGRSVRSARPADGGGPRRGRAGPGPRSALLLGHVVALAGPVEPDPHGPVRPRVLEQLVGRSPARLRLVGLAVTPHEQADHDGHHHGHAHAPASFDRAFAIGIALNIAYVVAEAGAGMWTGSVALLADAAWARKIHEGRDAELAGYTKVAHDTLR